MPRRLLITATILLSLATIGCPERVVQEPDIERALVLCIMVDLASMDGVSPQDQERILLHELGEYRPELLERPRIVVGTKGDAVQSDELEAMGWCGDVISSVTGQKGRVMKRSSAHAAAASVPSSVTRSPVMTQTGGSAARASQRAPATSEAASPSPATRAPCPPRPALHPPGFAHAARVS